MQIFENKSLKSLNTFGIDAHSRFFCELKQAEDLYALMDHPVYKQHSRLILGGGSNLLFTKDHDGLAIKNSLKGIALTQEDAQHYYVTCAAGEVWHHFVQWCITKGYAGLENLSLIPGCTGASPMQNIGAYGVEIKDYFQELEAVHLGTGELVKFSASDCEFGYRESVFKRKYKNQFIITSVTYRLNKQPVFNTSYGAIQQELDKMKVSELSIQAISEAVIHIRQSKLPDPAVLGNAGSFFKNPEVNAVTYQMLQAQHPNLVAYPLDNGHYKLAAGWLIEQAGFKGLRRGNAGVHTLQALVLVNYGGASGAEIYALSEEIITTVHQRFGVQLEREVNIL